MDADCYLLGGDGNALGPYQLSTVQNWYDTGQIAAEQNMSVGADGAWQEAQYVLAGAELDMGTVAEEDTGSAITSLSTDCFLLDAEGQALGPFALADVASWLEQGSIDGETQMASFDGNEWVNVQVALRPGASSGKSKESRLFLFSVAEGTSLGPFNHSDVLTWYTSGDIGGDQYVSNEENPEDWVTAMLPSRDSTRDSYHLFSSWSWASSLSPTLMSSRHAAFTTAMSRGKAPVSSLLHSSIRHASSPPEQRSLTDSLLPMSRQSSELSVWLTQSRDACLNTLNAAHVAVMIIAGVASLLKYKHW